MSVHQLPDGRWVVQYKAEGKLKREYFGHVSKSRETCQGTQ